MTQTNPIGMWFDDPFIPGVIRWHNGVTFTGLAGKSSEIFYFIQTLKGNLGVIEPFRDPNETLMNPTPLDVEILQKKLVELAGRFPSPDELRGLWEVPNTSGIELGWKELTDDPEHCVFWYGEASSDYFKKEHVVAANFMFPAQVAGYITSLPSSSPTLDEAVPTTSEEVSGGPVSDAPPPENPDMQRWVVNPEDPRELIFWNGDEWSKRQTLKDYINNFLDSLGITMPTAWIVNHSHSRRDLAIARVLNKMGEGPAWVRDPESDFYDLKVRWWDGSQFTDAVGADAAGWYDAPYDKTKLQWWNGVSWDQQFLHKEQIQIEEERREAARDARVTFALKLFSDTVNAYLGGSTTAEREATRERNREIQCAADKRSSDQWWEDRRKDKQDEAIRQQEKFYRKANERRGW